MMMRRTQEGFTLVEMIMVIVITGIIGGMVAVFLKAPIQQYLSISSRADMTDVADTALRRIGRDLRLALPNSVSATTSGGVRYAGGCTGNNSCFIEFLPTTGGGRYRAAADSVGATPCGSYAADVLDFTIPDTCFEVLGPMPTVNVGDQIVVYNLGISGASAYTGNAALNDNRRPVIAPLGANYINITSANPLPFSSPSDRFQVVTTPVSYVCDGAGNLWRYWNYPIQAAQPSTIATLNGLAGVLHALMATNVSTCSFDYNPNAVVQRYGLVTMKLGITESLETVSLYNEIHVSNVP
jgi:MSHA biogenesis protein MshO